MSAKVLYWICIIMFIVCLIKFSDNLRAFLIGKDVPNGITIRDFQVACDGITVRYTVRDMANPLDVDTVCNFVNKWKKGE